MTYRSQGIRCWNLTKRAPLLRCVQCFRHQDRASRIEDGLISDEARSTEVC